MTKIVPDVDVDDSFGYLITRKIALGKVKKEQTVAEVLDVIRELTSAPVAVRLTEPVGNTCCSLSVVVVVFRVDDIDRLTGGS